MTDIQKGMILGASNALLIAFAFALCAIAGVPTVSDSVLVKATIHEARDIQPAAWDVFALIAFFGVPAGAILGAVVGAMTESVADCSRFRRTSCVVVVAMLGMGLCCAFWPEIRPCAYPATALHAVLFARWTTPRERIPRAAI